MSGRRAARLGVMAAVLSLMASCAPRVVAPPPLDLGDIRARYERRLVQRLERGRGMNAGLVLWAEGRGERLPGAQGDLTMAGPDRVRLRISSMLGTAIDLGVRGDSLLAWVPAWRTGLRVGSASESLGISEPGGLVYRVLSGNWTPPASAWDLMMRRDSLVVLSWSEDEDSLHLTVGSEGLPRRMLVSRGDQAAVEVHYRAWDQGSSVAWPSQIELLERRHDVRLLLKASQLRFPPQSDTSRLAVRIPQNADMLTLARLRNVLDRLGVF